jgi:hypothetical protein
MKYIFLDWESYWSTDYSLSKMPPAAYVMDPRWECQSLTVCIGWRGPARTAIGHEEIVRLVASIDWSDAFVVAHNNEGFDSYVSAWRYGIRPAMWGCSMAMARPLFKRTVGIGLGKLVEHFGIGIKNNAILIATRGRYLRDFSPDEIAQMRVYNADDTLQCREVFFKLLPFYDREELFQIDLLIRMRVEPAFVCNFDVLEEAAKAERQRKHENLLSLADIMGVPENVGWGATTEEAEDQAVAEFVRADLASTTRFAKLLESLGVTVPMKKSNTTDQMIPALAKTDQAFIDLQDHEDEVVATAARVRLDVKSTQLETRIATFQQVAQATGGLMPIPLLYCGAVTTGRDSGTDNMNAQNMPRIVPERPMPSDALRNCLEAPKGHVVIVADQSGIELRVNHFLWQVARTMQLYAADPKADLYRASGARAHGITPEEVTKFQRQIEKLKNLGLGFGAGPDAFIRVAKTMGGLDLTLEESQVHVADWRDDHPEIAGRNGGWAQCNKAIEWISKGQERQVDPWGLVWTCSEGFVLPSNRIIRYPNLRELDDGKWPDGRDKTSWFYGDRQYKARIHGPKADENIVQALGRDSLFDASLEFYQDTGWRPKLRVHDELAYVVPERDAQELLAHLQSILRKPPKWWPELITWSEGNIATRYGDAK